MHKSILFPIIGLAGFAAVPAYARSDADAPEAKPAVVVNDSATLTSDYSFRGVSQTDENMAVQDGTGSIADAAVVVSFTAAF